MSEIAPEIYVPIGDDRFPRHRALFESCTRVQPSLNFDKQSERFSQRRVTIVSDEDLKFHMDVIFPKSASRSAFWKCRSGTFRGGLTVVFVWQFERITSKNVFKFGLADNFSQLF